MDVAYGRLGRQLLEFLVRIALLVIENEAAGVISRCFRIQVRQVA